MVINFAFAIVVSQFTPPPPLEVQAQVERLREPGDA
jgi:Na+(H+)/acetate symporter ActP